jgi:hypothetical protein
LSFRVRLGVFRGFRDDQKSESGGAVSLLRRILDDLRRGENIDAYVTVFAAVVLSVLNIVNILPPGSLSGVILGVLALLAIGTLVTRAAGGDGGWRGPGAPAGIPRQVRAGLPGCRR